jgi:hypothetical protein
MSGKLRNIEALRKMLDGQHKSQTKSTFGYETVKQEVERQIGEVWTDENGNEWIQQKGFKIKKGKLDEIKALIASKQMPVNCPKCGKEMNHRLDKKFWALEKHCFDCQVAFEHELRITGKFHEYEKEKMLQNAEAWLKEAEQEAMEIVAAFRNPLTFANSDGSLEGWSGGMTGDEIADKIEAEFKLFKENFINKLKNDKTEIAS